MNLPDLSRIPRLRLRDGTVVLPALFTGPRGQAASQVSANPPDRIERDGEWYKLAVVQPYPYVLYEKCTRKSA